MPQVRHERCGLRLSGQAAHPAWRRFSACRRSPLRAHSGSQALASRASWLGAQLSARPARRGARRERSLAPPGEQPRRRRSADDAGLIASKLPTNERTCLRGGVFLSMQFSAQDMRRIRRRSQPSWRSRFTVPLLHLNAARYLPMTSLLLIPPATPRSLNGARTPGPESVFVRMYGNAAALWCKTKWLAMADERERQERATTHASRNGTGGHR